MFTRPIIVMLKIKYCSARLRIVELAFTPSIVPTNFRSLLLPTDGEYMVYSFNSEFTVDYYTRPTEIHTSNITSIGPGFNR